MNFLPIHTEIQAYAYVVDGGPLATQGLRKKWAEEVLPHFYAPASRQPAICPPASVPPLADADVELDSPNFVPKAVAELAARGYVRKNSWR